MLRAFLFIGATILFSGCGAITYNIQTNPEHSLVTLEKPYKQVVAPTKVELIFDNAQQSQKLKISKEGYIEKSFLITKLQAQLDEKNKALSKNIQLLPIKCQTTIAANADEVDVYIDDKLQGKTPLVYDFIFGKRLNYDLSLKKKGFYGVEKTIFYDAICEKKNTHVLEPIIKQYDIVSYPSGVEVYLDKQKLGNTPLKTKITFGSNGSERILSFKKDGYTLTKHTVHYDDKVKNILVKMEEIKFKDLAYIRPEVSMKDNKILFKVAYEKGYKDTIDNSPNALHVKQVLMMDNINYLIGDLDTYDSSVVYTVVYPKQQINAEAYINDITQVKFLIQSLERVLESKKDTLSLFLQLKASLDSETLIHLNKDLFEFFGNIYTAAKAENSLLNYASQLNDLKFSYEKLLSQLLTLHVSDFYSDIWMSDNTKGFKKTKITDSDRRWIDKAPSLDKEYIYFASNRNSKDFEIWRVSRKGGAGMTKITNAPYSQELDPSVDISGELISFTTIPMDSISQQVWTINKKGYLPSQLKSGYQTSITQDKIVFVKKSKFTQKNQIWIMNSDGTSETVLSSESFNSFDPSLSRDGKYIVYVSDQSGNKDIWMMGVDGSNLTQLTTNPSADLKPSFDEENRVVFISNRGMLWGIWSLTPLM